MAKSDGKKKSCNKASQYKQPVKAERQKGSKPDYTPRVQRIQQAEVVQTDLNVIWNGYVGLVEYQGMHFRVVEEKVGSERESRRVVYLVSAPAGTELSNVSTLKAYVSVAALHMPTFSSKFENGSWKHESQELIWGFLDKAFRAEKIKGVHVCRAHSHDNKKQHVEVKASNSVADFMAGELGSYCFDKEGPCAVVALKAGVIAPQFAGKVRSSTKIELVSVDAGHPLYDYVEPWAYIFHNTLSWGKIPSFTGPRAGECVKLWEFATDIVAEYRKVSKKAILSPVSASQDPKPGDKVPVPAEYRELMEPA